MLDVVVTSVIHAERAGGCVQHDLLMRGAGQDQRSPGWKLLAIARLLASVGGQRTKQAIAFIVWTSAEK